MRSIFLCESADSIARVYAPETIALLKKEAGLCETVFNKGAVTVKPEAFHDVRYIFSTWGMSVLTEEEIRAAFPKLECVFYGAGTVQTFARPFLARGVKIFSAWAANAVPVAEYTVSQILLANKGYYATSRLMSAGNVEESRKVRGCYPGNFGECVGLIGVGQVARAVIRLLRNFNLRVKVYDPFLSREDAAAMGVEQCGLQELFETCMVVSNHVANNPSTVGMLHGVHFEAMRPYATFINTGRGAQVVEEDLVQVLRSRPDLTAVMDVTWPEPPVAGHPFYSLPNCVLTPHIAGSSGDEVHRMSQYMVQEFRHYTAGESCLYEVTAEMLKTMA